MALSDSLYELYCSFISEIEEKGQQVTVTTLKALADRRRGVSNSKRDCQAAIDRWNSHGIANGYGNGTFRPDGSMTRAEVATMLVDLLNLEKRADISGYSDAKYVSSWALEGVRFAAGTGMLTGSSIAPKTAAASRDIDAALTQLNRL